MSFTSVRRMFNIIQTSLKFIENTRPCVRLSIYLRILINPTTLHRDPSSNGRVHFPTLIIQTSHKTPLTDHHQAFLGAFCNLTHPEQKNGVGIIYDLKDVMGFKVVRIGLIPIPPLKCPFQKKRRCTIVVIPLDIDS